MVSPTAVADDLPGNQYLGYNEGSNGIRSSASRANPPILRALIIAQNTRRPIRNFNGLLNRGD
jgi:hypothetical protein